MGYNADQRPNRFRIVEPGGGSTFQLTGEDFRIACNTDAPGLTPIDRKSRVNSSDVEVRVDGAQVVFMGRGFGHGVGMCQFCTRAFAERGEPWKAILARFYPGAQVVGVY